MIGVPRPVGIDSRDGRALRRPFESPAGLRLLLPGWPQLAWGQGERGRVLLGSSLAALGAGALAWGTWLSWAFFAFAFLAHVSSAVDAVRQSSFPAYPRGAVVPTIAAALAAVVYLPALLTLIATAWPGSGPDGTRDVYLVNCWAYRDATPRGGQWVWLRLPPRGRCRAARVIAAAGQEVEWDGRHCRVDGQAPRLRGPVLTTAWPRPCRFRVPAGQVLVEPQEEPGSHPALGSLVLVGQDQILGRAWAQYYPVWDRRLL